MLAVQRNFLLTGLPPYCYPFLLNCPPASVVRAYLSTDVGNILLFEFMSFVFLPTAFFHIFVVINFIFPGNKG